MSSFNLLPQSSTAVAVAGAPSPPPPTPSTHSHHNHDDDALSRFLLRNLLLSPPTLSPPSSRLLRSPPALSLPALRRSPDLLSSAASDFGFFHLADHPLSPPLADAQALLRSPPDPAANRSSLGFDDHEDDEDEDDADRILSLDGDFSGWESIQGLRGFGEGCKGVALEILGMFSGEGGIVSGNPISSGDCSPRCLIWVSAENGRIGGEDEEMKKSKCYPYIVGIHCEFEVGSDEKRGSWIIGDGGEWIGVQPCSASLLVTLGDIAQVWSNGRFKKVNGRPQPSLSPSNYHRKESSFVSLSFLLTLPIDSIVSPVLHSGDNCSHPPIEGGHDDDDTDSNKRKYRAFSLEEYAWRVYHERLPLKDPLLRFKV